MDFSENIKNLSKYAVKNNEPALDGAHSIFNVMDDKNKLIEALKKQILNQKVQLSYYLRKTIDDASIAEFKKHCLPTFVDENVRINMAMCKFYKENKLKTPVRNLFEDMFDLERRLHNTLNHQENMVQIILDIIMKFAKCCVENNDAELQLKSFLQYFNQFEIFNDLLISTKNLQNDLNTMKVHCNRLVVIEDERNAIVDQIYSRPLDQQACSNYVLSMLSDRKVLEEELSKIKNELQKFIAQIPQLAKNDAAAKKYVKRSVKADDAAKFEKEIAKLREEKGELTSKVKVLQKALESKIDVETKLLELEKKCEFLKERCSSIECQKYASLDVRGMEDKVNKLQERISLMKAQASEMRNLKKNLAYYKYQLSVMVMEKKCSEREKAVAVNDLQSKLEGSKDIINVLKKQVQYLLMLLYYMREDEKNKKAMEEMNHAMSGVFSDVDLLLLKTDLPPQINMQTQRINNIKQPLIVVGRVNSKERDPNENGLKTEPNEIELNDGDASEENTAMPAINAYDTCKRNNNSALISNYANSPSEHGTATYKTLDFEAGINTSLRIFVRKFDEIAQNINRILINLSDKSPCETKNQQ